MTDQTIPVGYVRRAHGIRGDVVVRGLVRDARDRFSAGVTLTAGDEGSASYRVISDRDHRGDVVLHLDGIDDRTAAEQLVGTQFVIDRAERRTLDPDEWWAEDLVGCRVVDRDGADIGTVVEVVVGAAQDRITVETVDGTRGEVPFVDELVPDVDAAGRRIVVDLPDGLFG